MKILEKLYVAWVALVFIVFMFVILPFILLPLLLGEKIGGRVLFAALTAWAVVFSALTFIRYKTVNRHLIKKGASYIYTCNHGSYLDSPALVLSIPGQFRPLGKIELARIPVFGLIVRSACVLVDRSSPESRKKSVLELKAKLEQHISIFIFPEGSMNRTPRPLTDFYDGAFRIAIENQVPILPMVVLNARNLMPRGQGLKIRPGKIVTVFAEPVPTLSYQAADVEKLKKLVYGIMENLIINETAKHYGKEK